MDLPATPPPDTQYCPKCNELIGALSGSMDAICRNCGFKDPCCEDAYLSTFCQEQ